MRTLFRAAIPVAFAGTLLGGVPSASALGAGAFIGTVGIDCFGCGVSYCDASLTFAGEVDLTPAVGGVATTLCFTTGPVLGSCVVSGSASGRVEGAVNLDFNWTRVGSVAVISTTGDIDGNGTAVFAVTDPIGNPCGQQVSALVVGTLVGL